MKRIVGFWCTYKLFSWALVGLMSSAILALLRYRVAGNWVLVVVCGIAVIPLTGRMWRDLRNGTYGIDILAVTAIVGSLVLRQYWAAIVLVIMLSGGESLEDFAAKRARAELHALLKREPQTAHLLRKGKLVDVSARSLVAYDRIVIKPGEVVPADAVITEGTSSFDESSLTGESVPQPKQHGDQILSGSLNIEGAVTAKVLRPARDSQYQQIIRLVRGAAEHPAPFVRLADRYSIPFTIAAYTIGGLAWILSHQAIRFLEVLVVATPCPLILAAPIALIAGMSRASRDGIIIKTGTALEQLAQAKTFAFDKTGTLTKGVPQADTVITFRPFKREDVLAYAASLEQNSGHVLAQAVVAAATAKHVKPPKAKHVTEVSGLGLEAHVGQKQILVGRFALLRERGTTLPQGYDHTAVAQTATYVAIDGHLAGYITFTDQIRPETKRTLTLLKQFGARHTLMVTGDNRTAARAIAKQLGITDIRSETLPGDKLRTIETLEDRPVAFVGDGVNDAPVLMAADVGIALGVRGSTAASESADVVIMQDNLAHIARAVALAQRSFRIASQSIAAGIGLSVILMLIFATGRFSPITGAIVQEGVDVLVIANALRAHSAGRLKA